MGNSNQSAPTSLLWWGLLGIVGSAVLYYFYAKMLFTSLGDLGVSAGGTAIWTAVVILVGAIINSALVHGFSKLLKVPTASWSRAFFVVGIPTLVASLGAFLGNYVVHLSWILGIISIILWFVIFMKSYKAGFGKTLGVGVLTVIVSAVITIIVAVIVGFGTFMSLLSGGGTTIDFSDLEPAEGVEINVIQ